MPDKNMKILGGKPLVAWVVDAITASHTAAEIWVATDDDRAERYLAEAKPHVRVYRRSAESATDTAPVIEVVREFIDAIRPAPDDMLVLAQATSPFTSPDDFRRLQQSIDAAKADSYIACLRTKRFVWNSAARSSKPAHSMRRRSEPSNDQARCCRDASRLWKHRRAPTLTSTNPSTGSKQRLWLKPSR